MIASLQSPGNTACDLMEVDWCMILLRSEKESIAPMMTVVEFFTVSDKQRAGSHEKLLSSGIPKPIGVVPITPLD
jgi:hypothetical protein